MEKKANKNHAESKRSLKTIRFVFFIVLVFFVASVANIVMEKYLLPVIAGNQSLKKIKFFRDLNEKVVVINRTEEVRIQEDVDISSYTAKASGSVVEILSSSAVLLAESGEVNGIVDIPRNYSQASGVVVSADGLIITHLSGLAENPKEVRILTSSGEIFNGEVLMKDAYSGIAVLRAKGGSDFPSISFVASDDVKIGTKIVVIGRNGANAQTDLLLGILSGYDGEYSTSGALASTDNMLGAYLTDLQDEFESRGQGIIGSAIVDYNGSILGMVGAKKEDGQYSFFVVPVSEIQFVTDRIIREGSFARPRFGAYYLSLTKESEAFRPGAAQGVMIFSPSGQQGLAVIAGSAADVAGFRIFDIIKNVNGEEVSAMRNLGYRISRKKIGEKVKFKVQRDGKELELEAMLQK